ncbi:hypothetical protein BDN72DRAFT_958575 [Pluteus cervinus]|uniref:Uncharacterized protein n=1 Tax=Pluteus cervinus TaxID=181527 RepID=A0ACD3AYZ4_9AGAR|nr:hypothetical protein BDN72DRAFT_958575 [Pluteus cervinus]
MTMRKTVRFEPYTQEFSYDPSAPTPLCIPNRTVVLPPTSDSRSSRAGHREVERLSSPRPVPSLRAPWDVGRFTPSPSPPPTPTIPLIKASHRLSVDSGIRFNVVDGIPVQVWDNEPATQPKTTSMVFVDPRDMLPNLIIECDSDVGYVTVGDVLHTINRMAMPWDVNDFERFEIADTAKEFAFKCCGERRRRGFGHGGYIILDVYGAYHFTGIEPAHNVEGAWLLCFESRCEL